MGLVKMESDILRVGRPFFSEEDISEITTKIGSILRSGWLTSGEFVAEFEQKYNKIVGTKYAVALSSCTAALHCVLSLLGIESNDEVIVPANTFASTANAAVYVGAKPIFADCDIETFNVTADAIESCITPKTRTVIVVHIAGNPCEMDRIVKICKQKDLFLIEDCAHAHGSKYKGKSCGSFGLAGAFSFYPTKVVTSGEGGMIVTNSEDIYVNANIFRNVGRATIGQTPITALGYNYRMSDIHACIGLNQLRHLDEFVEKRNNLARLYDEGLSSIDWIEPQRLQDYSTSSYYAYICRILPNAPVPRDEVIERLKERHIETTVMFRPVYTQPYYREKFNASRCRNAELVGDSTIVLPLHTGMNNDDVLRVINALRSIASSMQRG